MEAIGHGLQILSWYEAYPEKDIPPENIWDDSQGLDEHWKAVKLRDANGDAGPSFEDEGEDADLGDSHSRGTGSQMLGNDLASVFKD